MLHIRPLTLLDYPRYVELFQELGVDDPVPTLSQVRSELLPHLLVAEQDGGVVGFARVQCFVDTGYVRQIAVDSAVRRQGVGQALMAALRERFLQRGARRWCLNVKPNNWPARRLEA